MKVVINRTYGGFELSEEAWEKLGVEKCDSEEKFIRRNDRTNPELIKVVEELGERANTYCSHLRVVEIPDDVEWYIAEYDGLESIHEKHRVWI